MKKIFIGALAVILLIVGGVWAFLANFEIVKKSGKGEEAENIKNAVVSVCSEKDVEEFNRNVKKFNASNIKNIKSDILSRGDYEKDPSCNAMVAISALYLGDGDFEEHMKKFKHDTERSGNMFLKVKDIDKLYHYEDYISKNSKGL